MQPLLHHLFHAPKLALEKFLTEEIFPCKAKLMPTDVTDGDAKIHSLRTFGNIAWNQTVMILVGPFQSYSGIPISQAMTGQLTN